MADYDMRKICHRHISHQERFDLMHIPEPNSGCWFWLGKPTGSNGYGRILADGKYIQAHRYSYERFIGPIPNGMLVLHKCDTPLCVNPNHLFIGNYQDNSDDKVRKNRQARGKSLSIAQGNQKRRGSINKNSKLTESDVLLILKDIRSQREIAKYFGVTQATIYLIKNGKTWSWLNTVI